MNGHVGVGTIGLARNGADITNQDRVMVSSLEGPVDRNMNRMHYMQQDQETLAGNRTEMYVSSVPQTTTMNSATSSRISSEAEEGLRNELSHMVALSSEFRHVVELEIKDNDDGSKGKSVGEPLNSIGQGHHVSPEELISDDAVRRVVEMQQIVFDAESYLTEEEVTDTEHDYSRGDSTQDFEVKLSIQNVFFYLTA